MAQRPVCARVLWGVGGLEGCGGVGGGGLEECGGRAKVCGGRGGGEFGRVVCGWGR